MAKKKTDFGVKRDQQHRESVFDAKADKNLELIEAYIRHKIGDSELAYSLGLNGGGAAISQVTAYAVLHWAKSLERGEQDPLADLEQWATDYVHMYFVQPKNSRRSVRMYMTLEVHASATRIYEYLKGYPALSIPFITAQNGGISWRAIYWLALERLGTIIRRELPQLIKE